MFDYPPKIILAFGETISGNEEILNWLLRNGYSELAALSYSIRGSQEAFSTVQLTRIPKPTNGWWIITMRFLLSSPMPAMENRKH